MGAHFYLDMSDAEIDAARVPAWKRAVMLAAAHYGLFVGDTGGGGSRSNRARASPASVMPTPGSGSPAMPA